MNMSIYTSMNALRSYQRAPSSSPPQYSWAKTWLTLSLLGILGLQSVQAQTGAALHLDGSDDYVAISNTLPNVSATFTFEAWVNPDAGYGAFNDAAEPQEIISRWGLGGANNASYRLGINSSGYAVCAVYNSSTGASSVTSTTVIPVNTWTHIAAIRASDNTLSIYINGTLSATTSNAITPQTSTYPVYLGKPIAGNNKYKGKMDEVRIWNRALPLCEIQNNRNCELGSGQTGLLAYYQFNQGTANSNNTSVTSLTDASGNGLNGTLTNFGLTGTTSNWVSAGGVTSGTTCTPLLVPSVSLASSASGTITYGTSVTFTATPTNGGTTPTYQWKKNGLNISGTTSATYTSTTLNHNDAITCAMNSNLACPSAATVTSNSLTTAVNTLITPIVTAVCGTNNGAISLALSGNLTKVRYVRINQNSTDPVQGVLHLSEVRAIQAFTGTNVALNKTVTTFSTLSGLPNSYFVDGNVNTYGHSNTSGTSEYLEIDLGVEYLLDNIQIVNRGDCCQSRSQDLQLILKDGTGTIINSRQINAYQNQNSGYTTDWNVADISWSDNVTTLNRTSLAAATYTLSYADVTGVSQTLPIVVANNNVTPSVSIAITAGIQTTCIGSSVTFTATPTNGGTPTYQWKKNGTNISGETNATYTSTSLANNDAITCVLTSNATCATITTATSNSLAMTVNVPVTPSVSIAITTGNQTICAGSSVTFTATPTNGGTTPTYQWKKNGTNIGGETNATYTSTSLANNDAITCALTSNATCATTTTTTSNSLAMTVNALVTPSVSIAITIGSQTITMGTSVTFTATPTNGGTMPTYQWKMNGTNISGETNATYSSTTLANNDAITCVLTSNATCASPATVTSNSLTMTVNSFAGAALNFDGADDYVEIPHSTTLNDYINTGEITVEYWINPTNNNSNIIAKRPTSNSAGFVFELLGGTTYYYFYTSSGWKAAAFDHPANTWQHIAVTAKMNDSIRVYQNGVFKASASLVGVGSFIASTSVMRLMANTASSNAFSGGSLDEVRLWSRALPQCEIQNSMNCELGSGQTGLAAYYKFNQGFASTNNAGVTSLTDASGNSNTGTLTNFGLTGTTSNWIADGGVSTGTTCTALPTPSVSIAGLPSGSIVYGTSVTFTATPTNGGTTPTYQWKKNGTNVGTSSATYTDAALANADVITCVMTSNACTYPATATSNGVTMTVTYPAGAALNFDGADDYVEIPTSTSLNSYVSTGELTIEYWVKLNSISGQPDIMDMRNSANNSGFTVENYPSGSNTFAHILNTSAGHIEVAFDYTLNTWQHIAIAAKAGDSLRVYKNGVLQGTSSLVGHNFVSTNGYLRLMSKAFNSGNYSNGSLDEVRLWSRALSQCEIQNNMNCELGSGQTGLAAYYKFNQGSGFTSNAGVTSLTDASGNSNTGTLTNFGLTGTSSNWVSTGGVTTGTTCTALPTPSVSIAMTTGSQTICAGSSVTFTATPTNGGTTPMYQWKKNGTNISGATSVTYTSTILANNDVIMCIMTSNVTCPSMPTATSNSITMTVNAPPTVTASSGSVVCEGSTISLMATGTSGSTYVWTGPNSYSSTTQNPTIANTTAAMGGIYIVTATLNSCTATASTTVTFQLKPIVSVTGTSTVCQNATATLTATVSGGATVQWQSSADGTTAWTDITGATSTTLVPSTTTLGSNYYRIVATADGCTANSTAKQVTVSAAPSITFAALTSKCVGNNATLTTSDPLPTGGTYAWTGPNGYTSTAASPTISNLAALQAGTYSVVYTVNGCSATASQTFIVNRIPSVTAGNSVAVCATGTLNLTATSTTTDATYVWTGPNSFTSAAQNPFVTNPTAGTYSVVATASGCSSTAATTVVSVSTAITGVTVAGGSTGICPEGIVNLTSTVQGGAATTYQWQSSVNNTTWGNMPDSINSILTPSTAQFGTKYYRLAATNACGTVNSTSVSVVVTTQGSLAITPTSSNVCIGSAVNLTISTSSLIGTPTYQWQNSSNGVTFADIVGATNNSYVPSTAAAGTMYYRLIATTSCGAVTSNIGQVKVGDDMSVSIISYSSQPCANSSAILYGTVTGGTGTATYQWQSSPDNTVWTNIAGANRIKYTVPTTTTTLTYFRIQVTDNCGSKTSSSRTVTFLNPSVLVSLNSASVCIGNDAVLSAVTRGTSGLSTYQWESSTDNITWTNITGARTTQYKPSTSRAVTQYFRFKVIDNCGTFYSTATTLTVINPVLTVTADATEVCQNTVATLTATTTTGTPQYQWQSSANRSTWTNISGATAAVFAPATSSLGTTYYRVVATYGSGCTLSSAAQVLTISASPTLLMTGGNVVVVTGSRVYLNTIVSTQIAKPIYQWQKSTNGTTNWTDIVNTNVLSYNPSTEATGILYYRVKVTFAATTGLCNGIIYSNISKITVNLAPPVRIDPKPIAGNGASQRLLTDEPVYCAGTDLVLESTCGDATAIPTWTGPNGFTASTANITLSKLTPVQSGNYRVIYLTQTGYIGEQTISIKVSPELAVTKTVSASTVLAGTPVKIAVSAKYKIGILAKIDFGANTVLTSNNPSLGSSAFYAANDNSVNQQWFLIPKVGTVYDTTPSSAQPFYLQSAYSGFYMNKNGTMVNFSKSLDNVWNRSRQTGTTETGQSTIFLRLRNQGRLTSNILSNKGVFLESGVRLKASCNFTEISPGTMTWNDGETATTRTVSPTATTNYIATFTTSGGCIINDTTTIVVPTPPTVSVAASSTTICQTQTTTLSATVLNNIGTATYQWQSSLDNINWVTLVGATSSSYNAPTTTAGISYYRVAVTNSTGTNRSSGVQITVTALPSVSISASQPFVCPNGVTTLMATYPTGYGTPTVQWQSSDNGSIWVNIAGATSDTYLPITTSSGKKYYRYIITLPSACISILQSQSIAITVNPPLTVGISGIATQTLCKGSYRVFTLTTNIVGATYAWESSTNGTTWTPIANETTANYITPTTTAGTTYYRGTITSGCSAVSATRQVTVTDAPTLTVGSPTSATCLERTVSFSASLSSTSAGTPSYVWQTSTDNLNWSTQSGATGSAFTPSAAAVRSIYVRAGVKFASCADSSFSVSKPFTVNANPSAELPIGPLTLCSNNSSIVLSPTITGGAGTPTYTWEILVLDVKSKWVHIPYATNSTYTISTIPNNGERARYRLRINYDYCPETYSTIVEVGKRTTPLVSIVASGTSICQGTDITLTGNTVTNGVYQWQSSPNGTTWTDIIGATASTYIYNAAIIGTTQFRLSVLADNCAPVISAPVTIVVDAGPIPTLSLAANNSTLCGDAEVTVTATATGSLGTAPPQYQWQRNGQFYSGQPSSFTTKTMANGLGATTINDIAIVGSKVFVATSNGLAISTDGGKTFINKTTADGLVDNYVSSVVVNLDGSKIILGTPRGPVTSLDNGSTFKTFSTARYPLFKGVIASMCMRPDGSNVYITTNKSEILIADFNTTFLAQGDQGGALRANSINFKDNNTGYFWTNEGMTKSRFVNRTPSYFVYENSGLNPLSYKRAALKGDTIFVVTASNLYYIINNVSNSATGLPTSGLQDVAASDNVVYVTATSGLFFSKDGGKTFSDITTATGLSSNPGLGRIILSGGNIYMASSSGLKIATNDNPIFTFTTNKSDKIDCILTTISGGCARITKQSLTLNYIGDVDPLSIKVTTEGVTGTGTWTAVNNATGYGWELMKYSPDRSTKTFVKNGTVTTNSLTLNDLNPSTNYELTVKTLCNMSSAFARLVDAPGTGTGGSTSFTTGFVVPQVIKDSLVKAASLCAEDSLILGRGFPTDYQVNIYSGTDKTYIDYASAVHPFKVKLTANTKYYYKVVKFDVKSYTFTASNNDAGSESKRYTVPTGVSKITFKIAGSKGAGTYGGDGGATIGTVTPTAGTTYYLFPGTTTTADAGISRGTSKSANGGGGSYVSTSSLRSNAIMVAGGGGGSTSGTGGAGGVGGIIAGNGFTGVTGGTAIQGGASVPSTGNAAIISMISQRTPSGFMKGSSTNNVTSTLVKADYGGGGGYYGGGSYIDGQAGKYAGAGGGSSYANTTIVKDVLYENGTNTGTGYVTVYEYSQATANSDFLPLDIAILPVPTLLNQLVTVTPNPVVGGSNFQATVSLTGNAGFPTTYTWTTLNGRPTTQVATGNASGIRLITCKVSVSYCNNRLLVKDISKLLPPYGASPPDSNGVNGNRLLTPTVSIASSTTHICAGEEVIFTATPVDIVDENLTYTWRRNGVDILSETNDVLQTSSLSSGDVITCTLFYPTATGETDSIVSANSITMTVATPAIPKVTIAASTNNVCLGTEITFTPTPTAGGTTPQYRWYLNGDLVQTSDTYTSSSFENNDFVECIMESDATCIAQAESEISANVPIFIKPSITPTAMVGTADTFICNGSATVINVNPSDAGSTPQYQWVRNGESVGTNSSSYTATNVASNDAIWCVVTPSADACANIATINSDTTTIQTAEPDTAPSVIISMSKDSICTGDEQTFSATGSYLGSEPVFEWHKNGVLIGNEAMITLSNLSNGDIITCTATSSLSCVSTTQATSNALTAKVVEPATPTVAITTTNTTICPNTPVVITASLSYGGTTPQYDWRLNNAAYRALPHSFVNFTTDNGLGADFTQAVFVKNDTVYVATVGGVSYRINGDSIYTKSYKDGLATSNVQTIYADDNGVYAGTDNGLSISTDGLSSFRPVNSDKSGLLGSNITAITSIGSILFVGTTEGLSVSTDRGNSFTSKTTADGLKSNSIKSLFVDGTTLYIGTEGGLNISTDNGATFYSKTTVEGLNSDNVLGVWAKDLKVFVATQQGLAISNDGGLNFTKVTMDNGLPNLQVNNVLVVADSMVYAATSGGLAISKNGGKSFKGYFESDTLGSNTVLGVAMTSKGALYVATTGGLSLWDGHDIRVYPNDGDVFATNLTSNKSCVATSTATSNNLTFFVGTVSAASLAATSVKNTSATLTWTGTVGSYNWRIVPTGTGLDGTVVASGTTTTMPITATGLTVLTTYDLFVQGACTPDGTVDWVGPLTFTTTNNAFVSVKTLLHGAYDATTGLMNDNLRSLNLVPTTEPYTGLTGFTHVNGGGGEKTSSTVLAVTGNDAIVDWVFVELRDKMTSGTVIATRSVLIQRDGDVVDEDGISPVSFNVASDDYYISVRHRNHLGVRTAATVTLDKVTAAPYDFTTAANKALNSIQKDLTGGKFGMYAGNINGNNTVQASGSLSFNDYLNLIGLLGGSSGIQTNVYSVGDVNMDGTMRASGSLSLNDYLKIINAIGSAAGIVTQPF